MDNVSSPADAINKISERLRRTYRPYAGAQFRFAFFHDEASAQFLTGHVVFREQNVPSRPQADYKQKYETRFVFVEHWCREQWEAVRLLEKVLAGGHEIEGHRIEASFSRSSFDHRPYPYGTELWPGWELRSSRDRIANSREIYVPQGRLTALGLKSYRGTNEAINDWIFGLKSFNPVGADVPHQDAIVTFLSDSRGRILGARWQTNELRFKPEVNAPPEQVELQVLHEDSADGFQVIPTVAGQSDYTVTIPEDTSSLSILLLDEAGEPIIEQTLDENNRTFGERQSNSGQPKQGATILDSPDLVEIGGLPLFEEQGQVGIRVGARQQQLPIDLKTADKALKDARQGAILTTRIALFISHSTLDRQIAEGLTEVVKNSLDIDPGRIRCTSVEGHRLKGGAATDSQLRQELLETECFIGLLTPQSVSSTYVLFELGARWGANQRLIPLLAAGLQGSDLKGPLTAIHAHSCDSASQLHQLIDELAESLNVKKRPAQNYEPYVERLVSFSEGCSVTEEAQGSPQGGCVRAATTKVFFKEEGFKSQA